jgi:hypothetical protein
MKHVLSKKMKHVLEWKMIETIVRTSQEGTPSKDGVNGKPQAQSVALILRHDK